MFSALVDVLLSGELGMFLCQFFVDVGRLACVCASERARASLPQKGGVNNCFG